MPVITKCPRCGFQGNHGFIADFAYTVRFYHGSWGNGCEWYKGVGGRTYLTFSAAIDAVHRYDRHFDKLWVHGMLHGFNRRLKLVQLYHKRLHGTLKLADKRYLVNKGYSATRP